MAGFQRDLYQASKPGAAYDPGQEFRERQKIQRAINEAPVVLAEKFKLEGNDASDNAGQMNDLSIAVNGMSSKIVPRVVFPSFGTYRFTAGLAFTRPVALDFQSATLNYVGTGDMCTLGVDGIDALASKDFKHFSVSGGFFIGGANATAGFRVKAYLISPYFENVFFNVFGNADCWAIDLESQNWDTVITGFKWYTNSDTTGDRNGIRCNYGTNDNGQTRLRVYKSHLLEQGFGAGTAVKLNGANNEIVHSTIAGFGTNVWLASRANYCNILYNNFETTKGTECIQIGDRSGLDTGDFIQYLIAEGNYCNMHNSDSYGTSASFIGPATTDAGLQFADVVANRVVDLDPSRPMVRQNSLASQNGNYAARNRGQTILHTSGGLIDNWDGTDGP